VDANLSDADNPLAFANSEPQVRVTRAHVLARQHVLCDFDAEVAHISWQRALAAQLEERSEVLA
jgi:hypothetical protein